MGEASVRKKQVAATAFESVPIVGGRPEERRRGACRLARPGSSPAHRPYQGRANITLINMNLLYINLGGRIDYETHPPLGLLYLTSVLERAGHTVDFIDYQMFPLERPGDDPFNLDSAVGYFGEVADIVGLSCMANLLPFTLLVAERLKRLYPDKTIVLGGVGPFGVEPLILDRFPWVDLVVRGEAESTIAKLIEAIRENQPLAEVPGLVYRASNGSIMRTGDQPRIRELDAIPFPAYHRLHMPHYDALGVISSRGCPYRCTFCSVAPVWNHRTTYRSHDNILEEIRLLYKNYGVDLILFQDEFFYSSEAKMLDFCERLRASGLPIAWKCFGRVNLVTEHAMRRMAEAGCVQLRFGIESASDRVLAKVVKGFRFKDAIRVVTQAVGMFESVETFFIWGFPFEDMGDFYQSAIQMAAFQRMGVNVLPSLLSMLPQTEIYSDYQRGCYRGQLTLAPELVPIYVITGHEVVGGRNTVPEHYRSYYDFIKAHPDVFPGFLVFNYETNVSPKYQILRDMGLL